MTPLQLMETALLVTQHVLRPAPPQPTLPQPKTPINLPDGKFEVVDKKLFFEQLKKRLTSRLDQVQVDTINRILAGANHWPLPWVAYGLATAWHEALFKPIPEWGKGKGRAYAKAGKYGQSQYGRGLVQLTWDRNYEWADAALGLGGSLLRNFDRALEPDIAARILVLGMETGAFTGKALKHYLSGEVGTVEQFRQARRIINGMDKASKIAQHAIVIQDILLLAGWRD